MTLTWATTDSADNIDALRNGQSCGDWQVGDEYLVRFEPTTQPDDGLFASVNETIYVEDLDQDATGKRFGVNVRTEYIVSRDREDWGGTEVWSNIEYEDDYDVAIYETPDSADAAARRLTERLIKGGASELLWDGRTRR